MKASLQIVHETARRTRAALFGPPDTHEYAEDEAPLRLELFSAEQMQQHGKTLAGWHTVSAE
ncbi:MAG TPA: hypothetical protein VLC51_05045, partial [Nitrospira sp.]|nr:hypothetical protein [Nitrospira sp.]